MIQSVSSMSTMTQSMRAAPPAPPEPEEMFSELDTDGDESLSLEELQSMTEKMGENGPSVEDLIAELDSDGDGALSFAEFEAGRPQGPPEGGPPPGQLPPGTSMDESGQLDLASLFGSEEDEETAQTLTDLYAYA